MEDSYTRAIEVNDEVVCLVSDYQGKGDHETLLKIFNLLDGVTMQEIISLLKKAGLQKDLIEDMRQDAYLKLRDACIYYNYARCPVFITFWRSSLKNHLIKLYQKRWRHFSLEEERVCDTRVEIDTKPIEDLRDRLIAEFSTWKDPRFTALATRILNDRILKDRNDKTPQRLIAEEFEITQAQISNWEKWIKSRILPELQNDLI